MFDRVVTMPVKRSGQVFLKTVRMPVFGNKFRMFLQGLQRGGHMGRHG